MATTKPAAAPASKPSSGCASDCLPVCNLEKAFKIIVDGYHQYVLRHSIDDNLDRKELNEMLQCQAPTFLAACKRSDPKYLEKLFKESDLDKNNSLTFDETVRILSMIADDFHRLSHGHDRCGPDHD